MNKKLTIGQTAELLGVAIQTLRRWDKDGSFVSHRENKAGNRYYYDSNIEEFLKVNIKYLLRLAHFWAMEKRSENTFPSFYCSDRSIFKARLSRLEFDLKNMAELRSSFSLITSIVGEIGNNSFDHNLGNWPDIPGIFFGYSLKEKQIILADRGQGILKTLQNVRPGLKNDQEALETAFTQYISGRAPEQRGNGLKYVKEIVMNNKMELIFKTGKAKLELQNNNFKIKIIKDTFQGCFSVLKY